MIRLAAVLLSLTLASCTTTSTVHQQHAAPSNQAYSYAFENKGGDDVEGIAQLDRLIQGRLRDAGLLAAGPDSDGRVEIELTHYYVRSNAARFWAGIMAGRDKIISQVTVLDAAGTRVGHFEVETTNISAWGTKDGLMEKHADEIVIRLKS